MREAGQPAYLLQNKTPYEIRTQLIEIAQNYLQAQYEANLELARATFDKMVKHGYAMQSEWEKHLPKMYDFNEILEKARELYQFVDNKK